MVEPVRATLLPEYELLETRGARLIAGVDEVGRGALAGPVSIGVVVIDLAQLPDEVFAADVGGVWAPLDGVRDSKLLTPAARRKWQPIISRHVAAYSVQHQGPEVIDAHGLTAAMNRAGRAGLDAVEAQLGRAVDAVILDGVHDWLAGGASERVITMPKADMRSLTVACASVLAKVERDGLMTQLGAEQPGYGWESNKGYGSSVHREAIRVQGPSRYHRRTWNLGLNPLPGL